MMFINILHDLKNQTPCLLHIQNLMETEPKCCKKMQILKFRGAKRRPKNLHRGLKFNIDIKLSSITPKTKFQASISNTFGKMSLKAAKTQIFKFRGAKRRPKNLHRRLKFYIHIKLSSITPHTKFQAFILKTF